MDDIPEEVKQQARQVAEPTRTLIEGQSAENVSPMQDTPNSDSSEDTKKRDLPVAEAHQDDIHIAQGTLSGMPEEEKQRAMQATEAVRGNIQMVEHTGNSTPVQDAPNSERAEQVGQRINNMQRNGYDAEAINTELTKDDFVRE